MTPDDPRHGTHRGYVVGCREECCTRAHTLYMKLYRMGRRNRLIATTGTNRRIDALACLGWSMQEIAYRCGFQNEWIYNLRRCTQVTSKTAARIARVYDEMSMTLPPERTPAEKATASKARARARLNGYLPPLAWNDIDDPDETPATKPTSRPKTDVDPVVILRVIAGDKLPMTRAERVAVVTQMSAAGWSQDRIERHTGITRVDRLIQREAS